MKVGILDVIWAMDVRMRQHPEDPVIDITGVTAFVLETEIKEGRGYVHKKLKKVIRVELSLFHREFLQSARGAIDKLSK